VGFIVRRTATYATDVMFRKQRRCLPTLQLFRQIDVSIDYRDSQNVLVYNLS